MDTLLARFLVYLLYLLAAPAVLVHAQSYTSDGTCPTYVRNSTGLYVVPVTCASDLTACCMRYDDSGQYCCQSTSNNYDTPGPAVIGGVFGGIILFIILPFSIWRICARMHMRIGTGAATTTSTQRRMTMEQNTVINTNTPPGYGINNGVTNNNGFTAKFEPPPSYQSVVSQPSHYPSTQHHHSDNSISVLGDNSQPLTSYDPPPSYTDTTQSSNDHQYHSHPDSRPP